MKIDTATIQKLRNETGAGIMDTKKALQESNGDYDGAVEYLKKYGQKMAAKKKDREASEGVIGNYTHTNGKVGAVVALACETDFVANTDDFKILAHDLAMHITATNPLYLVPDEIPAADIEKEKEIYRAQLKEEKKPEKIWDNIMTGKLEKYYGEVCLLKQRFIKDDEKTIEQLLNTAVVKLGENIQIKSFSRLSL